MDGKSLDSQQREAIVVDEDAVKVIAGAGSGKTFTIQGKVKFLTEKRDVETIDGCSRYKRGRRERGKLNMKIFEI